MDPLLLTPTSASSWEDDHDFNSSPITSVSSETNLTTTASCVAYLEEKQHLSLPDGFPQVPHDDTPDEVADADTRTPDNWVKRNPELVRLTGKHPFNAEATLSELMSAGFFTPAHLHFVRNHGAVPQIKKEEFESWTIRVHGLVEREVTFSLSELKIRFETVTLPVTLVCAGNRRKEQNVVRKSLGFDWGAAGLSTALWTGVYLADVLEYVRPIRGQAKHVIFEGADSLPKGPYGTSQRLSWAASREKGMLIGGTCISCAAAWAMNGLPLEPDHGFPVRVIIPGQIGGRSVKACLWLRRIELSQSESEHHLHFWDNKVLPRHLSPDIARNEPSWWHDPAYLITELSVNSIISSPSHGETLHVAQDPSDPEDLGIYTLQGYSYSGGGRRVTRCEVSLDEGNSWLLARIEYPEDRFRQAAYSSDVLGTLDLTDRDTSFCWCFWSLEVPVSALLSARVIEVCAMDESMNMQPRDIYLNATSMLNNWLFRVAVLKYDTSDGCRLIFEHPAPVGTVDRPGWMERMRDLGSNPARPIFSSTDQAKKHETVTTPAATVSTKVQMVKPGVIRKITPEELSEHSVHNPWFVVHGEVYDGTPFLDEHPGGSDSILLESGQDATEDFIAIHSADARVKLAEFHIGTLVGSVDVDAKVPIELQPGEPGPFLDPRQWRRVSLVRIVRVNHDCCIYRFELGDPSQTLGLSCGQHVFVRIRRGGELVQRAYTPISALNVPGEVELLVKLYQPNDGYPLGGRMSALFRQLALGEEVELKGPIGSFVWTGRGSYLWRGKAGHVKDIGMICAGSGITPIYQVLRGILHDQADEETRIRLICGNRTIADILLREELDELLALHGAQRFKLHHTLSRAPEEGWTQGSGRICYETMAAHLPSSSSHSLVLACGPPAMIDETVKPALRRLGWNIDEQLVVF
ncbi:nitrate reductase [Peniophora sp. CONT]|nr:nitrate reductase [Peniophora sp. CONT]